MLPLDPLRVAKVWRIPEIINAAYVHLTRKTTVNLICDHTALDMAWYGTLIRRAIDRIVLLARKMIIILWTVF